MKKEKKAKINITSSTFVTFAIALIIIGILFAVLNIYLGIFVIIIGLVFILISLIKRKKEKREIEKK